MLPSAKKIPSLPRMKEAPDADAVLAAMSDLPALGLPEDEAARLVGLEEWETLVRDARQEWETRRYWLATLPLLPKAIAQVEVFLSAQDPAMRRAAACALALLSQTRALFSHAVGFASMVGAL